MRRAISCSLLASLILSSILPATAQQRKPLARQQAEVVPVETKIASAAPTPPMRRSPVTPACTQFESVEAFTDGGAVGLKWRMAVETQNVGFNVYAIDGTNRRKLNDNIIAGGAFRLAARPFYDGEYRFVASSKEVNSHFLVETVPLSGAKVYSELFSASKVTSLATQDSLLNASPLAKTQTAAAKLETSTPLTDGNLKTGIQQNSLAPDPDTQKWVAAQPGVKFGVKAEGLYQVTKAQLQAAGFDVASDPTNWQLYVDGHQQAINVEPNGDYIEFYGKGIDRVESDTRIYFLVAGPSPGKRMLIKQHPGLSPLAGKSYTQTFTKKERTIFVSSIVNGDAENYFGRIVSATPTTMTFNLTGISTLTGSCAMSLSLQGFSFTPHPISVTLNGHLLDPTNGDSRDHFTGNYSIPIAYLNEGSNSLLMVSSGGSSDFSVFDQLNITFDRTFLAQQNTLSFATQNYRAAEITGFSSPNVRVFDTSFDGDVAELTGLSFQSSGGSYGARVPANRARTLFAVDSSAILAPATIEQNNPSTLSTTAHNAQLIIISYKGFLTQANAWADYRRNQGISVEVVDVADVFDEFNYGVLGSDALTSFLQYAKSNWQTPPQYALLIGDATYDPRMYEAADQGILDYVPAKSVSTLFGETPSDDALVDFNNDGLAEIAIGRIPARDGTAVTNAMNKVINFEQLSATHTFDRGALFVYDVDPSTWDFQAMSNLLSSQLPGGTSSTFVGKFDANAMQNVVNGISSGNYVVNYSGHGSTGVWSNTGFFGFNNVTCNPNSSPPPTTPCINNPSHESIFTALTCFNGYFLTPTADGLSERLLKATNGGAVAVWSSTGETTPDVQQVLAARFYGQLGQGNIPRLGDLIIDAKLYLDQNPPSPVDDVLNSWVLLGDPMLKIKQ